MRNSRRRRFPTPNDEAESLNVTPYLDVLVNLIMFLLVTEAALTSLGVVDVTAPIFSTEGSAVADSGMKLTIGIARDGFFVAAKGGVLGQDGHRPTIAKRSDGQYDYAALASELRAIKRAFPEVTRVYVAADEDVTYEAIVNTLDASRSDREGPLFPAVAFVEVGRSS